MKGAPRVGLEEFRCLKRGTRSLVGTKALSVQEHREISSKVLSPSLLGEVFGLGFAAG